MTIRKSIIREQDNEWCEMIVELRTLADNGKLELSICGSHGYLPDHQWFGFQGSEPYRVNGKMYRLSSCGQIHEELTKFFPEHSPYFKWHLNTMHAECEHQELRGETWKHNPGIVCLDCGYKLGS